MEKLIDNIIKLNFDDLIEYSFPLNEPFGLRVNYNNITYEFIIRFSKNNKNLICMAPSAHARDERTSKGVLKTPPFFDGYSWYSYFDESFISYADPTLSFDDKIRMGWLVGDKEHWYLEDISLIILELTNNQQINSNNILFYGSSSGGFISAGLGTLIKGSKVLVNNSQFNIFNYYPDHVENLFKILRNSFIGFNDDEIKGEIKHRFNLIELFKKKNYIPPITYYLNISSKADVNNHAIPLIKDLFNLKFFNNNINVILYNEVKEKPHNPIPGAKVKEIIKTFSKIHLYNDTDNIDEVDIVNFDTRDYINNLEKQNLKIKKQNKKLKKQNKQILNSKSWKVTKPLRNIFNKFR